MNEFSLLRKIGKMMVIAPSITAVSCSSVGESDGGNFFLSLVAIIGDLWLGILASLVASIIGFKMGKKHAGRSSDYPRKIKEGTKKNSVLVVGLGRSGKTCLIEMLTRNFGKIMPSLTKDFKIRSCARTETGTSPLHLHLTDYRGQDFAQLISNLFQQQLQHTSFVRYGEINSLIIVVDLFRSDEDEDYFTIAKNVDTERVQDQIEVWTNPVALDAVFGSLSRPAFKYACLFINKIDKWEKGNFASSKKRILKLYKPLINDLEKRTEGITFDVLIGSALRGDRVLSIDESLMEKLYQHSVRLT